MSGHLFGRNNLLDRLDHRAGPGAKNLPAVKTFRVGIRRLQVLVEPGHLVLVAMLCKHRGYVDFHLIFPAFLRC